LNGITPNGKTSLVNLTVEKRTRLRAETPACARPLRRRQALRRAGTGKPPFKASEGGCFENLRVSEDITPSEFYQGKGTRVPIRPKVRLEASPNGLPMSVSSKVYQR